MMGLFRGQLFSEPHEKCEYVKMTSNYTTDGFMVFDSQQQKLGNDPHWLVFSAGLKPPTRSEMKIKQETVGELEIESSAVVMLTTKHWGLNRKKCQTE